MNGQIDIKHLNTIRELLLCNILGYVVIANGTKINHISELILKYKELNKQLFSCKDKEKEHNIINTLNEMSAFFYRCNISENGSKEQKANICRLELRNDYWTNI